MVRAPRPPSTRRCAASTSLRICVVAEREQSPSNGGVSGSRGCPPGGRARHCIRGPRGPCAPNGVLQMHLSFCCTSNEPKYDIWLPRIPFVLTRSWLRRGNNNQAMCPAADPEGVRAWRWVGPSFLVLRVCLVVLHWPCAAVAT